MKRLKDNIIKVFVWIVCLFIPAALQTVARTSGYMLGSLPTVLIWGLFAGIAIVICRPINRRQRRHMHDEQDRELQKKTIGSDFEKILDNSKKADGEDSIAYIARCMRESEKEKND